MATATQSTDHGIAVAGLGLRASLAHSTSVHDLRASALVSAASTSHAQVKQLEYTLGDKTGNPLWEELRILREDIEEMKAQLTVFQREQTRWSLRYSRRIAVASNLLSGAWVFISRMYLYMRRRYNLGHLVSRAVFHAINSSSSTRGARYMTAGCMDAAIRSLAFFGGAYLISRRRLWVRRCGLVLASLYAVLLSFTSRYGGWLYFLNTLCCFLYATTEFFYRDTL